MNATNKFSAETKLINDIIADSPSWAAQTLKEWDNNNFRRRVPFASEIHWSGQQSINVFDVVGTAQPHYQGMSWLTFLAQGKQMGKNLLLQDQNPDYYLTDGIKLPAMYYISIDGGGWYVAKSDGNHRTCIARFMFHQMGRTMLHGVNLVSYRTDMQALAAFQRLRAEVLKNRLPVIVSPHRRTLSHETTPSGLREHCEVRIRVEDTETGRSELLTPTEADAYTERIIVSQNSGGMLAKFFNKLTRGKK